MTHVEDCGGKHAFMAKVYQDVKSKASFSSEKKLLKEVKDLGRGDITPKDVKDFLSTQKSHTRHGVVPHLYRKRIVIVGKPGSLLSSDLADVTNIKDSNDGFCFLALFIDCFSRKLDIIPIRNKMGGTVSRVLNNHLEKSRLNYTHLWVDLGKEYYNRHVNKVCEKHGIIMYSVHNSKVKAAYAERALRTIKTKLYKMFTHFNSYNYTKYLDDVVASYNMSPHRGLMGMTPNQVHEMTDAKLLRELTRQMIRQKHSNYGTINRRRWQLDLSRKDLLQRGTYVRILENKAEQVFNKSYLPIFSEEIFVVDKVNRECDPITYSLKDLNNEDILGVVYRNELKKTKLPSTYDIEKVVRRKICKKTGRKLALVKFLGYSDKFNEWIPNENVERI